jgi:hypothetical protein
VIVQAWPVDHDVREDELSTWVPSTLLPEAVVGDVVVVRSAHLPEPRRGTVAEIVDDDTRGRFHRLTFEGAPGGVGEVEAGIG